jgi:NAD(P)-dependent dehydrogenase (short-subunit alcohol dehydrogenase family)
VPGGRFEGKVGLVTGASGGIGAATAGKFAAEGAHVVLVDVNDGGGTDVCNDIVAKGFSGEYLHCDLTRSDEVDELFSLISARHPQLHFAANVVGGTGKGDRHDVELHEQSQDEWDSTMALSLRTTFLCMTHEIASMLRTGGGAIVNVSSMAGLHVSFDATASYSAAKAAVNHLTRYAAVAYAERSIRVNVVAPGVTATPNAVAALGNERMRNMAAATHCIPQETTPDDQASAIVWLCSDETTMVTGHILPVDGGWNAK